MSDLFFTTSQSSAKFYIVFMPKAETKIPTFKTRNLNYKTASVQSEIRVVSSAKLRVITQISVYITFAGMMNTK